MQRTIEAPSLLGDSIYSSYFLARYAELHPDEQVVVVVPEGRWSMDLYRWIPGVTDVRVMQPGERADIQISLSEAFNLCTTRYGGVRPFWHTISESLGVNTDDMAAPPIKLPVKRFPVTQQSPVVMVPYSVSCASRGAISAAPNKMLSWEHWRKMYAYLLHCGQNPLFAVGSDEPMPDCVASCDVMSGASFNCVLHVLAGAKALIAVDNGMVRLAALLDVPVFFTKPAGLGQMFIPTWGSHVRHEFGHPASYTVEQFREHVGQFMGFE